MNELEKILQESRDKVWNTFYAEYAKVEKKLWNFKHRGRLK